MKTIVALALAAALCQGAVFADDSQAVYAFNATYAAQNNGGCIAMEQGTQAGVPFLMAHEPLLEAMIKASAICFAAIHGETTDRSVLDIPATTWAGSCALERSTYPRQYPKMYAYCKAFTKLYR